MRKCPWEKYPEWHKAWYACKKSTNKAFEKHMDVKASYSDIMNTFWLENRRKFRVLEKYDRVVKRLDFVVSKPTKRTSDSQNSSKCKRRKKNDQFSLPQKIKRKNSESTAFGLTEVNAKRQKFVSFSCDVKMPVRPGRKSPNACWICGYRILGPKDKRVFGCCKRISHQGCWKRQFDLQNKISPLTGARCDQVVSYLKKIALRV